MGWTWQGGLAGTTAGRIHGFGVDQVLQIEAVLPNGVHVIFGPSEWEEDAAYIVPKTTKVSGICADFSWSWGGCPSDVEDLLDDLWYAFRGGGGGTWGVVLSMYVQLHEYQPLLHASLNDECFTEAQSVMNDTERLMYGMKFAEMSLDWFLDPDAINITKEESNACGLPTSEPLGSLFCFADDVNKLRDTLSAKYIDYISGVLSDESWSIAQHCLDLQEYLDYGENVLARLPLSGSNNGKISDTPGPNYISDTDGIVNYLVPKSWVMENKKYIIDFWFNSPVGVYFAFGGNTEFAHDKTSSLSTAHREAGLMIYIQPHILQSG